MIYLNKYRIAFYTAQCPIFRPSHILNSVNNDWKKDMGGVLAADDVINSILFAYQQPQNICIREIVLAATRQEA